jgi:diguanylate cyclase (GGDEF)-like protein
VLLLRESDAEGGLRAAARLRADLAARPVTLGGAARVITFSAGVAAADEPNGFDTEGLVARADEALYRAKRGGRDRTELEAARIHAP